ncbi:putative repeat protein (TIGR03843 family) [Micrococcus endophyticus]|uniref:Putative repeat protein (TIGR03843 family) n=1 Tax=Micrococcus endophyticus TaxID=455343 RepID=A0A7W9JGX3_9MICC|nr:putative repeat protein (TIGR03843 family) [Micrococcus endophyticus]
MVLAWEDMPALRHMAVFDVIVNIADRKGAHILAMPGGHRYGVDHGLTFHVEDKLRTVLWGWLGEELSEEDRDGVGRVLDGLDGELGRGLAELLSPVEIGALAERCAGLLDDGAFPAPSGRTPAVPWPLL